MVSAWDIPANPLTDPSLDDSPRGETIRLGYRIFTNTPQEAPGYTHANVSCSNCHLNAGQRERALPLVGVSAMTLVELGLRVHVQERGRLRAASQAPAE